MASKLQPVIQIKPEYIKEREREREAWDAWWKVMSIEMMVNPFQKIRYYAWRGFDIPVCFFRERIIEPLQDKYKWKFYHRRFSRVPDIDECGVTDQACIYQANFQYRLDKLVDTSIMVILKERMNRCLDYNYNNPGCCAENIAEFNENELNFYIKFGEIGSNDDAVDVYNKQKHRMIWERRHPKLMEARARAHAKYREELKQGVYDQWFHKRGATDSIRRFRYPTSLRDDQIEGQLSRDVADTSQDPERLAREAALRARGEPASPDEEYSTWSSLP